MYMASSNSITALAFVSTGGVGTTFKILPVCDEKPQVIVTERSMTILIIPVAP
jgi:hypothetical protein